MGSGKVGMRKVLLGRVWAKMDLLEKMDVGKGYMSRNKGFGAKWGSLGKIYQAFYGLEHYNLLVTGSFLIRKLNQPTSCLVLQFKGKNTLKLPFDSSFK